jgi:peptide/nickel transport system ATP-binding protein
VNAPLLSVEALTVRFPAAGGRMVHAVEGVSFTIEAGQSFGLVGESGSGKSTTAQAVMKLVPARAGRVMLNGEDILALKGAALRRARRLIQMIFQDPYSSLDPRRRALDLICEPIRLLEPGRHRDLRARAQTLLDAVGLPPSAAGLFPHQFSGGQRQRLCIARALSTSPALLVCDEAVSALDAAIQAQILNLLHSLRRERGLALLFISHDLGVVQHMCDEIAVMYMGEIVERAPRRSFFAAPRHPYSLSLVAAAVAEGEGRAALKARYLAKGDPPSPIDPPPGCCFAARCPFAIDKCRAEHPVLAQVSKGHLVACHRWAEIAPAGFAAAG